LKIGQVNPNGYLTRLARAAMVRELERVNIQRSLSILQTRIAGYFREPRSNASEVTRHFAFGSFTRGTMLPRNMDPLSDVDYLIIFANSNLKPQSCLDRLRRFVEKHYRKGSEIKQSHPTIILSLNHIRFELVPAIETSWNGIQIPVKDSLFFDWSPTNPNEFNAALTDKNRENEDLIKPLIRITKYWNALNDYPFESYALEQKIVAHWKLLTVFAGATLWRRFRDFINDLDSGDASTDQGRYAISRAQTAIEQARQRELENDPVGAERILQALLPRPR
jgi:hypothetical protein